MGSVLGSGLCAKVRAGTARSALAKVKKGFFQVEKGDIMPVKVVEVKPFNGGRRINIVGVASDRFQGTANMRDASANRPGVEQVFIGHRGYDYTFMQLDIDQQGNGKGTMVFFANVVFNKEGGLVVKPMSAMNGSTQVAQLVNAHEVK